MFTSFAQSPSPTVTNGPLPVVTIVATDPIATLSGGSGTFTVFRAGDTNATLDVYYEIGGTASNGVDYALISNWITLSAGVCTNSITITPINHGQGGIETVVLQLAPPPIATPVNYDIGSPSNAVVYVVPPEVTNPPAVVTILATEPYAAEPCGTNPAVPGTFTVYRNRGTNIDLVVRYAIGGSASNGVDYAAISNAVVIPKGDYSADIGIKPLGNGLPGSIETVVLQVVPPICPALWPPPPECYLVGEPYEAVVFIMGCQAPTNLPPVVRIVSPADSACFRAPVDIPIFAYAFDPDGYVTTVEFFAGTNSLGFGNRLIAGTNQSLTWFPTNLFFIVWSNAPLGTYALTAEATDNGGASTVSEPVNVTILPPPPPTTNLPPVVSIVATDPVAIEGTNCWVWPGMTNWPPTWSNWPVAVSACRWFTNCGPKNAIFTVRRVGCTNDALIVTYDIGGTATNGVDYVTLPGFVTIAAGERAALITLVSIDDGPPDITCTVVLKLTPSTNSPPDYLVGFPRRAAAIIVDGNLPWALTGMLPDGCFHLSANGPDGAWFSVEYSTDLVTWQPICTNQVVDGAIDFVDPDAPGDASRFYRAVPQFDPPLQ
jgi:hypothetical protein